jgi:hypothetical protein
MHCRANAPKECSIEEELHESHEQHQPVQGSAAVQRTRLNALSSTPPS